MEASNFAARRAECAFSGITPRSVVVQGVCAGEDILHQLIWLTFPDERISWTTVNCTPKRDEKQPFVTQKLCCRDDDYCAASVFEMTRPRRFVVSNAKHERRSFMTRADMTVIEFEAWMRRLRATGARVLHMYDFREPNGFAAIGA